MSGNPILALAPPETDRLPESIPGPVRMRWWGPKGNVLAFARDPIAYAASAFERFGDVAALAHGGGTNILTPAPICPGTILCRGAEASRRVTTRPEFVRRTLVGRLWPTEQQPSARRMPLRRFGAGLFAYNGSEHKTQRRMLMPAFNKLPVAGYADDMVAIARDELDCWSVGGVVDVSTAMSNLTKRIATKTLFGEDVGPEGGGTGQLIQESLRLLVHPMTRLAPWDLPGLTYHRCLNRIHAIDVQVRAMIDRKRASGVRQNDVLSTLLHAHDEETGARLSEEELLGHVGVLFAAGHETSANALTWTLLLLGQHPEIHADLAAEVQSVFQGSDPTPETVEQAPLLDRVLKESMRILPAVVWNARVVAQRVELGGHELPVGTEILLSIYETHRDPDCYADPMRFDPERWCHINPGPDQYLPFSAGPRMCIGATFAMLELKLVLAMILQRYRLSHVPGQKVDRCGHIVMTPKRGLKMAVHELDGRWNEGVGRVRGNVCTMVKLPDAVLKNNS